jgi:hypothetical protein
MNGLHAVRSIDEAQPYYSTGTPASGGSLCNRKRNKKRNKKRNNLS